MLSCFSSSESFDAHELSPSLASVGDAAIKLVIGPDVSALRNLIQRPVTFSPPKRYQHSG
jgi:hypothetical protein